MVQQTILEGYMGKFKQAFLLPIGRGPIDSHQPAGIKSDLFKLRFGQLDQAEIAVIEGAIFKLEAAEGAFDELTVLK